jgi:hypothetical protein
MQQTVCLHHVVHIAAGASNAVYQARISIHTNARLHTEVSLVALLALVHLWVTLCASALGRGGRSKQLGIYHGVRFEL